MAASDEVDKILKAHGAILKRHNKHEVWKFPGYPEKTFTRACTPSDSHAEDNQLRQLREILGLNDPDRGKEGQRRERKSKNGSIQPFRSTPTFNGALAEKLALSGITDEVRLARIAELEGMVQELQAEVYRRGDVVQQSKAESDYLKRYLAELKSHWPVRLWIWWSRVSQLRVLVEWQ